MQLTREVWLPVLDYEGFYEVSNLGRIRRDISRGTETGTYPGKILEATTTDFYPRVTLCDDYNQQNHSVHRIVLISFCGREPFEGAQACHNDGDPTNYRLTNLRWGTPVENQADVVRHGKRCQGEDVYGAKLTESEVREIRQHIASGLRNPPLADMYGVSISTIHLIRHNKIWKHVND